MPDNDFGHLKLSKHFKHEHGRTHYAANASLEFVLLGHTQLRSLSKASLPTLLYMIIPEV